MIPFLPAKVTGIRTTLDDVSTSPLPNLGSYGDARARVGQRDPSMGLADKLWRGHPQTIPDFLKGIKGVGADNGAPAA